MQKWGRVPLRKDDYERLSTGQMHRGSKEASTAVQMSEGGWAVLCEDFSTVRIRAPAGLRGQPLTLSGPCKEIKT